MGGKEGLLTGLKLFVMELVPSVQEDLSQCWLRLETAISFLVLFGISDPLVVSFPPLSACWGCGGALGAVKGSSSISATQPL